MTLHPLDFGVGANVSLDWLGVGCFAGVFLVLGSLDLTLLLVDLLAGADALVISSDLYAAYSTQIINNRKKPIKMDNESNP